MTAFWFWIIVAVAFAIAEVLTVAFFAVFLSLGALAAAVVGLLQFGLLVQAIVFGVIGVVGIFAARPFVVERLHIGRGRLQSGAESMIGQRAVLTANRATSRSPASSGPPLPKTAAHCRPPRL